MHFCGAPSQTCGCRTSPRRRKRCDKILNKGKRQMQDSAKPAAGSSSGPAASLRIVHRAQLAGMPTGDRQEVRVITATLQPGERTPRHTHRFPVTVYVLQGGFTLELEGREPVSAQAGEAMIEPPHVKMTGLNPSASEPTRLAMVYVSDPDTPFAELAP
jgi:quercetin dioxygenase-like cupin family protein